MFSIIQLKRVTSLICYDRICSSMFRYTFKNTNIIVTIHKEQICSLDFSLIGEEYCKLS